MSRRYFVLVALATLCAWGCRKKPPAPAPTGPATRRAAIELRLLVVDDAQIAEGLKLLRGEWNERSGGTLAIEQWTSAELSAAEALPADLVIYPSRHVGTLVERDLLRTVRRSVLESESVAFNEVYSSVRDRTLRYGNQIYGLTLGEPPLMLGSSASEQRTEVWEKTTASLATSAPPLTQPRAAEFLARGIALSQSLGGQAVWFEPDSMQPRIASEPFVRAYQQMATSEGDTSDSGTRWLGWPSASSGEDDVSAEQRTTYRALPDAEQSYNTLRQLWEPNEQIRPLTMLGFAGRTMSVTRSTKNSSSAFKLLDWLAGDDIAVQLSVRSDATLWFRRSQVRQASRWLEAESDAGDSIGEATELLEASECYVLPRIPGVDEYLQALEDVLAESLTERRAADAAIAEVVDRWNQVTDRYGRDRQRTAYRRHVGLDDLAD